MSKIKLNENGEAPACCNHANNPAVRTCNLCGAAICDVCLFNFEYIGDTCPTCASRKPEVYTPKRRQLLVIAYIVGILSMAVVGLFVSGALANTDVIVASVIFIGAMGVCVSGLAVATACLHKARGNPLAVWIAIVLNTIPVVVLLLLTIVGLLAN